MDRSKDYKNIHLRVPLEFHKKLRVAVALKETSIREYVMYLVEMDLNKTLKKKHVPALEAMEA